ncbi:MAG: GGDEF domain-containing protein [Coriobacteriia bacterium]|nr:GGDEF domain-containing protein [Coriobacteriia bacterium]
MDQLTEQTAEKLFLYLRDLIYDPTEASLEVNSLAPEFQDFAKGLIYFGECLKEVRSLAHDISRGDLGTKFISQENELASSLKSLQATLRHLTWQISQVAKGDYKQRVSFMGEFSQAINNMIIQLDERTSNLEREVELNQLKTQALERSNSLFEALSYSMSQWIILMNTTTLERIYTNYPASIILDDSSTSTELTSWLEEQTRSLQGISASHSSQLTLTSDQGIEKHFLVLIYPMNWYEQDALAFVLTDVTEEVAQREQLESFAYIDALTNVYNRRCGMERLNELLTRKANFTLCFIDLDNLKYVNDKRGHGEGDIYIRIVSDLLSNIDKNAIVSRLGGDEFMVLCEGLSLAESKERLEGIREQLHVLNSQSDNPRFYSISFGVVEVRQTNKHSASQLLSIVDEKMYEYKRSKKTERKALLE